MFTECIWDPLPIKILNPGLKEAINEVKYNIGHYLGSKKWLWFHW